MQWKSQGVNLTERKLKNYQFKRYIFCYKVTIRSFHIQNKAQPYPSEQAEVEQEKVRTQLATMSAKLNEIDNKKEPVYAFRVTSVKDSGSPRETHVAKNPGKIFI